MNYKTVFTKYIKKQYMLRMIALALAFLFPVAGIAGCTQAPEADDGKIGIVCTIFPQYDWVRQIIGEQLSDDEMSKFELTLLLDSRIDLHNFQPSVDDIVKISTADLFIYVGGISDEWVEDVLEQAVNKDMLVINLLEELGDAAKEETLLEGMEDDDHGHDDDEHDDEHDDDEHEDEHELEETEYDEHVWLSLKNAQVFCDAIANAISVLDKENSQIYQENLLAYNNELKTLDAGYQAAIDASPVKTLLFGDRFPFRYLMDDYGLTAYAAFPGCSAETEAGFETIIFLAAKADELNLNCIMVTESSDQSIARTVIDSAATDINRQILILDAMQSVTQSDIQNGTTYLSIMESNLNVLKEALQ